MTHRLGTPGSGGDNHTFREGRKVEKNADMPLEHRFYIPSRFEIPFCIWRAIPLSGRARIQQLIAYLTPLDGAEPPCSVRSSSSVISADLEKAKVGDT